MDRADAIIQMVLNGSSFNQAVAHYRDAKTCPECGQVFLNQWNGWTGIDAHWRGNHEDIAPYSIVWPAIKAGVYAS